MIRWFYNLNDSEEIKAGGKGASLSKMYKSGLPVPQGFIILSSAFEQYLQDNGLDSQINNLLEKLKDDDGHSLNETSKNIISLIKKNSFSAEFIQSINSNYDKLNVNTVAVRSSATAEDSKEAAWAGQLESYLHTTKEHLLENILKCWCSLYSPRALAYRLQKGLLNSKISVAVVVQRMIKSKVSGVGFSVHPVTHNKKHITIDASKGLGEDLVSGKITPDSYLVNKDTLEIISKIQSDENQLKSSSIFGENLWKRYANTISIQKLSDEQIKELSKIIVSIENFYGYPCDIEWALEDGKFRIVQSRAITTL